MADIPWLRAARSTTDIVGRAVEGDTSAFEAIVAQHHRDVFRVAFVIAHDPDLADQAVAATWSRAWRQLPKLRDAERLRPWLVAIAANEARRIARSEGRHRAIQIPIDVLDVSALGDPAARAAQLDLGRALDRLSADDRALIALRYIAGLDSRELGRALGLTPSGVRARLARLLSQLRKELSDD